MVAKRRIESAALRPPAGHYSLGISVENNGRLVFISGMTASKLDGSVAGLGDVKEQTRQACENLKAVVEAAGGTLDDICRTDVFVRNADHASAISEVRREYFTGVPPASTMVEVSRFTSPECLVEINAIAVIRA